jgi:hypothetical protein
MRLLHTVRRKAMFEGAYTNWEGGSTSLVAYMETTSTG